MDALQNTNGDSCWKRTQTPVVLSGAVSICFAPQHDPGMVHIEAAGLRTWTVGIRPGALERVTAAELCSEVNHAVKDVHRNYAQRLYELKKQRFGDVGPEPKSS